jgi:ankyrin repeat protein
MYSAPPMQTGRNPLRTACWNGHLAVVELLLKGGADANRATMVRGHGYCKNNFVSLFSGFTTVISVHTTVKRASITVLEIYYLSLSEYSHISQWILAKTNYETRLRLGYNRT